MRWWAWKHGGQDGLAPDDVRMYVLYQKQNNLGPMERSVGIKNGSYGVVNAAATRQAAAKNNLIITHELLHILGASDKYDQANLPIYPGGYADPYQEPLYPQHLAEVMGGRIPVNKGIARIPQKLAQVVVGPSTASEIGWYTQ